MTPTIRILTPHDREVLTHIAPNVFDNPVNPTHATEYHCPNRPHARQSPHVHRRRHPNKSQENRSMHEAESIILSDDFSLPIPKQKLRDALIPKIRLSSHPWIASSLPLGHSRFGGPADLPPHLQWPTAHGRPLLLLAQLNFANLTIQRSHPLLQSLPKSGWLCLFLDVDGDGNIRGMSEENPGVVVYQFSGNSKDLIRHDPAPPPDAQTWTQCHAVTYPIEPCLVLPDPDAIDSPLPQDADDTTIEAYYDLRSAIDSLAQTRTEVFLLGTPTLYNPDPRRSLDNPNDWMLLLQFNGQCSFLAGAGVPTSRVLSEPSFGSADFVQYFIRKSDFASGRLDRGVLEYMLT